jgi:hypothetical protein
VPVLNVPCDNCLVLLIYGRAGLHGGITASDLTGANFTDERSDRYLFGCVDLRTAPSIFCYFNDSGPLGRVLGKYYGTPGTISSVVFTHTQAARYMETDRS